MRLSGAPPFERSASGLRMPIRLDIRADGACCASFMESVPARGCRFVGLTAMELSCAATAARLREQRHAGCRI